MNFFFISCSSIWDTVQHSFSIDYGCLVYPRTNVLIADSGSRISLSVYLSPSVSTTWYPGAQRCHWAYARPLSPGFFDSFLLKAMEREILALFSNCLHSQAFLLGCLFPGFFEFTSSGWPLLVDMQLRLHRCVSSILTGCFKVAGV